MPSIFISYSHEDEDYAKLIKRKLTKCKSDVFLSGENIYAGEDWEDAIWSNLEECEVFLFLASQVSVKAEYPKFEIGGAFYAEKDIIPVLIDISPKELPAILKRFQALDFRDMSVEEVEKAIVSEGQALRLEEIVSGFKVVSAIFGGLWLLKKMNE